MESPFATLELIEAYQRGRQAQDTPPITRESLFSMMVAIGVDHDAAKAIIQHADKQMAEGAEQRVESTSARRRTRHVQNDPVDPGKPGTPSTPLVWTS